MRVDIQSRQSVAAELVDQATKASSPPLDQLWDTAWIKDSIRGAGAKLVDSLQEYVTGIKASSDVVLVVAGSDEALTIRAALSAVTPSAADGPKIIVFDGSLSPVDFAGLFDELRGKRLSMIAVTAGEEDLTLRATYAICKQFVHNESKATKSFVSIYVVAGDNSKVLAFDAKENDYPLISIPSGISGLEIGNTAGVIFPLMAAGVDAKEFLTGFDETIADPAWDTGAAFAAYQAGVANGVITVSSWQGEYKDLARWAARLLDGTPLFMPKDNWVLDQISEEGRVDFLISAEEGAEDIMTPNFDGANEDGSLELLVKAQANQAFFAEDYKAEGFKLCVEKSNVDAGGVLFAFLQISAGIRRFLLTSQN